MMSFVTSPPYVFVPRVCNATLIVDDTPFYATLLCASGVGRDITCNAFYLFLQTQFDDVLYQVSTLRICYACMRGYRYRRPQNIVRYRLMCKRCWMRLLHG